MSTPTPGRRVRGQVASYGEGRICSEHDCSTQLSRYNNSDFCWAHSGGGPASAAVHGA